MNTPRQLVSAQGQVTFSARYTPWGETLQSSGTGNFTYGYLGGVMDTSTGLLYVGNGQYYDPTTGRFLSRNAKPDQTNPYVPWGGNPTGALFAPLALLSLLYSRKKKRGTLDTIIILVVLGVVLGMSLTACQQPTPSSPAPGGGNPPTPPPSIGGPAGPTPTPNPTPQPSGTPITPVTPPACGLEYQIPNAELVAARIYYEGASSISDRQNAERLFIEMVWAETSLYQLQAHLNEDYVTFSNWPQLSIDKNGPLADQTDAAFEKDGQDLVNGLPNDAVDIVDQVLGNCLSTQYSNPFALSDYNKGIHWLSRYDIGEDKTTETPAYFRRMNEIAGCSTGIGCQVNDIRQRDNWIALTGSLNRFVDDQRDGFMQPWAVSLGAKTDPKGNTDCWWRGLYFFTESNFNKAKTRVPDAEYQYEKIKSDYQNGKFLCGS